MAPPAAAVASSEEARPVRLPVVVLHGSVHGLVHLIDELSPEDLVDVVNEFLAMAASTVTLSASSSLSATNTRASVYPLIVSWWVSSCISDAYHA